MDISLDENESERSIVVDGVHFFEIDTYNGVIAKIRDLAIDVFSDGVVGDYGYINTNWPKDGIRTGFIFFRDKLSSITIYPRVMRFKAEYYMDLFRASAHKLELNQAWFTVFVGSDFQTNTPKICITFENNVARK